MNKLFIFILCLCCALTVAQATGEDRLNDSDANVFGHVLDKKTGEHLPFINVLLKGTTIGTTTDNSGHYFLKNLPEGKFTLEYKALGYKTVSKEVSLKKGKTLEINVELEEDQIAGSQAVLRHLHAAMDLFTRRARQIKMRRIGEQVLHQRGAIHPAMRGSAPPVLGAFPFLVLIANTRAPRTCFLMHQRRFRR